MIIKNEYLREWLDNNYPLMKEDENCLIELDYFDMDRFSEWLVKKLTIPVVSQCNELVCDCMLPNTDSRDTFSKCNNCGRPARH